MAKIISFIKIRGSIDDLTCRDTEEGNIIGKKTGPSREKVLEDPKFEQTRRNAGEFKLASKDATLLRRSLGSALDGVKRTTLNSHVMKLLYAAAAQDTVHEIGSRYAAAGDVSVFEGFEFGNKLQLDWALPVSFVQDLNIVSGSMKVEVPSYIARKRNGFPKAATHFRIVSGGAAINFEEGRYVNAIKKSALLRLRKKTPEAISLEHALKTAPGDVVVQVLGIEFYTLKNGQEVLVKGGAVKILKAERVAAEVLVPVEVPQVEVPQVESDAEPFTKKRLQAFGDWRRKGRVGKTSCELRATSGEQGKDEQQEVQGTSDEVIASTSEPFVEITNPSVCNSTDMVANDVVGCGEVIPIADNPEMQIAEDDKPVQVFGLADNEDADELAKFNVTKPFTVKPFRPHIDRRIRCSLKRFKARNCELQL